LTTETWLNKDALSGTPVAEYDFNNTLDTVNQAPSLNAINNGEFVNDNIFGNERQVYSFDSGSGFSLDTTNLLPIDNYSIELVFKFDDVGDWQKIIDYENLTLDTGLYVRDGELVYYNLSDNAGTVNAGEYIHLTITRSANDNQTVAYINGNLIFSFEDSSFIADIDNADDLLTFFVDDISTAGGETSSGRIALLRLYEDSLSQSDVTKLAQNPFGIEFGSDSDNNPIKNLITYSYDKNGNLTSVNDNFSALTFSYDARNRLISESNAGTPQIPQVILNYGYDGVGNVISLSDRINGTNRGTNNYSYDALHRLTQLTQSGSNVSNKRIDLTYNPLGQYDTISRYSDLSGNNLVNQSTYTYDSLNRLERLAHNNGSSDIAFYDFEYDPASRINKITDIDGVTDYTYDDRDQLTGANHSDADNPDETYQYDANGNRINSGIHGENYVTGDGNRLLSDGVYHYEYDAEGNMMKRTNIATGAVQEYQWDYRNRMIAVIDKDSNGNETQKVEFTYDALDRRISKTVDTTPATTGDGVVTYFVYDGEDVHLEFTDNDGVNGANQPQLSQRYLHGAGVDQVIAQEDNEGNVIWLLTDHLGTIRDLVDDKGDVINHLVYDSFGQVITESDPNIDTRYLFTGREWDEEIGLYYYRARYYDAEIGRFISEDPIGFAELARTSPGNINTYSYVLNQPLVFKDPLGLYPWDGTALEDPIEFFRDAFGADKDFYDNYMDMREANTIGADKYFHCKANCEAAKRGPGGELESYLLSEIRELFDEYIKGDSPQACNADRTANNQGRQAGSNNRNVDCRQACSNFRPPALDPKY
jgi:RHS repeat-associated protein